METISGFQNSEVWIKCNSYSMAYGQNVPSCDPLMILDVHNAGCRIPTVDNDESFWPGS